MIDSMLQTVTVSRIAVTPLLILMLTGVYGLNEMRISAFPMGLNRHTAKELTLSASYIGMVSTCGLMLWGIIHGAEVLTWRGALMIGSFAGVIVFVGKFHPWRKVLPRTVPIGRQWRDRAHPTSVELAELVAECRRAVYYGADECLRVLPKVIDALEALAAERQEMERIRSELVFAVHNLKKRFRMSDSLSPDAAAQVEEILDRLQKALGNG